MANVKVVGVDKFIRHVSHVATEAKRLDQTIVRGVALEAKGILLATAATDAPGLRLSRFANGKGITLSAHIVEKTVDGTATASIYPTPPGPWYLLEKGAKAHEIGIRVRGIRGIRGVTRGMRGQRNQIGFLGSTDRGFAAIGPVNHPPTSGKHTFDKGATVAVASGEKAFASAGRGAYMKLFKG